MTTARRYGMVEAQQKNASPARKRQRNMKGECAMENIFLAIKYVAFAAMELSVLAIVGAAVAVGVYQVVRDKVRESRQHDQVAPQTR